MTDTAIEAADLTLAYGRRRAPALNGCSFRLAAGRVCALVGPNGAGKSTLLALAAGLLRPTSGRLAVLGTAPAAARPRVAYVAQDKPLHPGLSVAETLRLGAELNRGSWDAELAARVVADGDLDAGARVCSLSGGQRTRLALALALGKRAELLLLDEPMADLDPLARHRLMGTLMAEAAEHGTTVVMSSHILGELADACDHLLLVSGGRVRLGGGVDDLVHAHALVTGTGRVADLARHTVVESRATGRGLTALIRTDGPVDPAWDVAEPSLEELLLAHLRAPDAPALITPGTTATRAVAA
ncbi:ABC transporter ATP-binding protein [Streptomyces aurantiacus]|uniref:Putative Nod factor export ATP-binding protein I n=1 Tax=Streptomyces aurantiacus JA 4570 TaxID=1286094 RepID=S4AFK3_9ACTN|nr:ABC transporter ATP-binding protein [Streptomyces aurantiacus]EPH40262.1 putative Nod factor export ATP-binding protein I [Streptomyces aurantiacus JA 4570]